MIGSKIKKVLILGSGINGIMSAYFLGKKSEFDITVIDKMAKEGMGCSFENGCQLSFSHCEPWSSWSSIISILKMIFQGNAKISLDALKDRYFWKWLYAILKNSFFNKFKLIKELTLMGISSRNILHKILQDEELSFDYNGNGILHFYRKKSLFKIACKTAKIQQEIGCNIKILTISQLLKLEPSLKKLYDNGKLVGGIMHYDDASGDIKKFMSQIKGICENKFGVKFIFNNNIKNILTNKKEITGVNTDLGVYKADYYISCLGAFEAKLTRGIGLKSKCYPIKGYSLSIPINKNINVPKYILTDPENKIVYSIVGKKLRAAGTFEISPINYIVNSNNIKFLKNVIRKTFCYGDKICDVDLSPWQGYRPYSSDILPSCEMSKKYNNFYSNSGHGSLGWTMSFFTAKKISKDIS
jgi:D-amino-acid dehydrogenase